MTGGNGPWTVDFGGWIVIINRSDDSTQIHGERSSIEVQQSLFEDWAIVPVDDDEDQQLKHAASRAGGLTEDGPTLFDDLT